MGRWKKRNEGKMKYSDELISKAYQLGYQFEATRGNCPQCVLAALMDTIGGIDEKIFQSAYGLHGGTVSNGVGTCGALAGAIIAIGTRYGRDRVAFDRGEKECKNDVLARELCNKFFEVYGGLTCTKVQTAIMGRSFNMKDPEERKLFLECGGHVDKCTSVVGNAAKWTIEILNQFEE